MDPTTLITRIADGKRYESFFCNQDISAVKQLGCPEKITFMQDGSPL